MTGGSARCGARSRARSATVTRGYGRSSTRSPFAASRLGRNPTCDGHRGEAAMWNHRVETMPSAGARRVGLTIGALAVVGLWSSRNAEDQEGHMRGSKLMFAAMLAL